MSSFMLYARGSASDYDDWKMPGWSSKDVIPLLKSVSGLINQTKNIKTHRKYQSLLPFRPSKKKKNRNKNRHWDLTHNFFFFSIFWSSITWTDWDLSCSFRWTQRTHSWLSRSVTCLEETNGISRSWIPWSGQELWKDSSCERSQWYGWSSYLLAYPPFCFSFFSWSDLFITYHLWLLMNDWIDLNLSHGVQACDKVRFFYFFYSKWSLVRGWELVWSTLYTNSGSIMKLDVDRMRHMASFIRPWKWIRIWNCYYILESRRSYSS